MFNVRWSGSYPREVSEETVRACAKRLATAQSMSEAFFPYACEDTTDRGREAAYGTLSVDCSGDTRLAAWTVRQSELLRVAVFIHADKGDLPSAASLATAVAAAASILRHGLRKSVADLGRDDLASAIAVVLEKILNSESGRTIARQELLVSLNELEAASNHEDAAMTQPSGASASDQAYRTGSNSSGEPRRALTAICGSTWDPERSACCVFDYASGALIHVENMQARHTSLLSWLLRHCLSKDLEEGSSEVSGHLYGGLWVRSRRYVIYVELHDTAESGRLQNLPDQDEGVRNRISGAITLLASTRATPLRMPSFGSSSVR